MFHIVDFSDIISKLFNYIILLFYYFKKKEIFVLEGCGERSLIKPLLGSFRYYAYILFSISCVCRLIGMYMEGVVM